jgi:predicted kinase
MLIVLAGLPGVGKTTVATELARALEAVHVRIDSIEHAIRQSSTHSAVPVDDAGYLVGYAIVEDNLKLGRIVIADAVNPWPLTRDAWVGVACRAGVPVIEIEVICSDVHEHRRRIETRTSDLPGFTLPAWRDVEERDYRPWDRERTVIDTANASLAESVARIRAAVRRAGR